MFDLNQQIAAWKSAFARKKACSTDELDELESHLREQVAAFVATGLAEQEAFAESVVRVGDPQAICSEFAKNQKGLLADLWAIRAGSVLVALVGVVALVLGSVVWLQRGDGLLGAHLGSIIFGYVTPFLLALVGAYAVLRAAIVKTAELEFRDRLAVHFKFHLGMVALLCAAGAILGGFWAERHWGRFWGWDPKEIGALAVVGCAVVLFLLIARYRPTSVQLGQASLLLSLVTFVAWFGPAVYMEAVGATALACLIVGLIAQLSMLAFSLFLPRVHGSNA